MYSVCDGVWRWWSWSSRAWIVDGIGVIDGPRIDVAVTTIAGSLIHILLPIFVR